MTETQIQSECVKWLWNEHPYTRGLFFAVQNNSEHIARAMQRKGMGLIAGVSDTIFLWNGNTYLIEFKTDTGRQSKAQKAWQEKVGSQGFQYYIIRSVNEFKNLIREIL
jgi:ATP-dependent exoDNAse (exonuclease V) beta subunit